MNYEVGVNDEAKNLGHTYLQQKYHPANIYTINRLEAHLRPKVIISLKRQGIKNKNPTNLAQSI